MVVSEMFVEGFIALMRAGVLKREVDGVLMHAGFFRRLVRIQQGAARHARAERAKLHMTAISFVNELYGGEEEKRRARVKARFINNAMMATLLGAVVSDTLEGGQVVSGVGGQYNFVAQAFALADARSILMLRSTRSGGGRTTSNVLWEYGHTTIPRHLRDIVITEYGIADLRGKSDRDCIAAMLAVTDSRFQDGLLRRAKDAGKIEKQFELPAACRDNTPHGSRARSSRRPSRGCSAVSVSAPISRRRAAADAGAGDAARSVAAATGRLGLRGLFASPPARRRARLPRPYGARSAEEPARAPLCGAAARRSPIDVRHVLQARDEAGRRPRFSRPRDQAMTISLYKSSVPIFVQFLTGLSAVLDKAAPSRRRRKSSRRCC